MEYIHGTATKMTVCVDNAQKPLIIDISAQFSLVAREYLEQNLPNLKNQLFPTKAKNFKSELGKMTSIGTIYKEIIIPHIKGNIRLKQEFLVLEDAHIIGFLLGAYYKRISNLTSKKAKFTENFEEEKPSFCHRGRTLRQKRGHAIELYLGFKRDSPQTLRRPPYPASLETRKEIEKQINYLLGMDIIRQIGYNEIVEVTTPALIMWHDGRSRFCGDFRALNNYTKAGSYPIPRIPNVLDKLEKAK
ncbi:hypothetical protein O181_093044 [Austropuccinia psidii MF-1]|uniref:Reverse transcriptase/retrotransposon-derived protein RNase H-like domain-containing protein n=1 Tax=Austropuccinia psidii MF-1 TaxID=1389203 RepID=A0A9Q3J0P3_9BASI|nr:hypothetical protein [Austropuccinia psidii MF-1]